MFLNVSLNLLAILYTIRRYDSRQCYYFYRQYSFANAGLNTKYSRISNLQNLQNFHIRTSIDDTVSIVRDLTNFDYPDTIIRNVKSISIELDSCRDKGFVLFHH